MQVYEQVTPEEQAAEQQAEIKVRPRSRAVSWTLLQAAVCLLILLAALLLQTLLPAAYAQARAWYDTEMQRSIVITADDVSGR